ncbi:acetylglutamate kinase [Sunxiuqinia elliptica]|uniref:Acetylglutamate kinase n=1 Tax=Sunxiuqinia elliptica TaxID=655355 RepID=A0A4R6HC88_9BACT|nr:acetylglutamate kinase [Sunxiuqinia elliptica]TDO05647.1 N-acetylglutamate kinase [Sunxiuqinia elliptica]TDO65191.1 N-acetylglutamate kinase [Sunxiuqinia elliptica]
MSKQKLTLVKVGGKVVEEKDSLQDLLARFAQLDGLKVLVHGGGRSATAMAERMGVETQMVDGRRITDANMLEVVTMVYGGLVNKNIVAQLQANAINAIGLTGADLNYMQAVKRPVATIDYGFVGDVVSVHVDQLKLLVENQVVPVLAPLTHDKNGQLLNTNADTIAAEAAIGFSEYFDVELVFCFEKPGVLEDAEDDRSVIASLNHAQFKDLQASGAIHAGMIPKLDNSFNAIQKGVSQVRITNIEGLQKGGTLLVGE